MSLITVDQLDMAVPMARYEDLVEYVDFRTECMAMRKSRPGSTGSAS